MCVGTERGCQVTVNFVPRDLTVSLGFVWLSCGTYLLCFV